MSHSASGEPPTTGSRLGALDTATFPATEWRLLTRLPGRVVTAALATEIDRPGRTVREGLAGLEGIAAGRAFDSELVRAVVAKIYAESDDDRGGPLGRTTGSPGEPTYAGAATSITELFAACRAAVRILARRADPADSAAYRQWVQSVAARVCQASGPTGSAAPTTDPVDPADRRFLDELGTALGLG